MSASEEAPAKPVRVSKAEIIDSIPGRQQDKFAIQNAVESEPGEFVKTKVMAQDFQDIPKENLDAETVKNYSGMDTIAPPVIATTGEGGLLKLKDGRHRILAAALKAKEAGVDPNNATVDAYVPESWAKAKKAEATVVSEGPPVEQTAPQEAMGAATAGSIPPTRMPREVKAVTSRPPSHSAATKIVHFLTGVEGGLPEIGTAGKDALSQAKAAVSRNAAPRTSAIDKDAANAVVAYAIASRCDCRNARRANAVIACRARGDRGDRYGCSGNGFERPEQ